MKKLIALLIVATIIIGCPGFEDMVITKTAAPEGAAESSPNSITKKTDYSTLLSITNKSIAY